MTHFVGLLIQLVSTVITACGYVMMSHSSKWYRFFGNILVVGSSSILGGLALHFAPQSLIGPVATLTVAWTTLIASWFGQHVSAMPVVRLVAACMILAALAQEPPTIATSKHLFHVLFISGTAVAVGCFVIAVVVVCTIPPKDPPRIGGEPEEQKMKREAWQVFGAFVLALMAGVLAGFTDTNAKAFVTWFDPISGGAVAISGSVQIFMINAALQRGQANRVIAIYTTTLTTSVIIMGVAIYKELKDMAPYRAVLMLLVATIAIHAAWECYRERPPEAPIPIKPIDEEEVRPL